KGASYTDVYNGVAAPANRETWIKIEIITLDAATLLPVATDKTADFLSLGVTYKNTNTAAGGLNIGDDRAIFNMQRYEMIGPPLRVAPSDGQNSVVGQSDAEYTQV